MQNKYLKLLVVALAVAFIVPQIALASWWNPFSWGWVNRIFHFQRTEQKQEKQVVCTQDAKLCPDGSYVSRKGPKCEFEACPVVEDKIAGWTTYTSIKYGYEIKYPKTSTLEIDKNYSIADGCVVIKYKNGTIYFAYDSFNATGSFCGGMTGRGTDNVRLTNQKLTVGSKDYYFSGDTNSKKEYLQLNGSLSDKIGLTYSLNFNVKDKGTDTEEVLKLILSTFKFTAPSDKTVDWKTYTNNVIGYQIKYPANFSASPKSTSDNLVFYSNSPGADLVIEIDNSGLSLEQKVNKDVKNWEDAGKGSAAPLSVTSKPYKMGDLNGYLVLAKAGDVMNNTDAFFEINGKNNIVTFHYSYQGYIFNNKDVQQQAEIQPKIDVYNQIQKIISTFKFIK